MALAFAPLAFKFPQIEIMNLDEYDVCVEFTNFFDGDYSEQFLLWDIDYYKD